MLPFEKGTDSTSLQSPALAVHCQILDLSHRPIVPGQPHPTLHRTASGHLFVPPIQAHSCERCTPRVGAPTASTIDSVRFHVSPEYPSGPSNGHVFLKDGPAKMPVVVERFSVLSYSERGGNGEGRCKSGVELKRKGRLLVNYDTRRSLQGVLDYVEDEGSETGAVADEGEEEKDDDEGYCEAEQEVVSGRGRVNDWADSTATSRYNDSGESREVSWTLMGREAESARYG